MNFNFSLTTNLAEKSVKNAIPSFEGFLCHCDGLETPTFICGRKFANFLPAFSLFVKCA